jgi:5-methyltetrahydrofolate--homocysteine methyltransferase
MTFEDNRRTFLGCDLPSMALTLEGLGADAIGVNCSLGPREFPALLEELARWTSLPLVAQPNAGLPDPGGKGYDITPEEFADSMRPGPAGGQVPGRMLRHRSRLHRLTGERLDQLTYRRSLPQVPAAVCSGTRTVPVGRVRIIGERINPREKAL